MSLTKKKENYLLPVYDSLGVNILTRLRLQIIHLNEHKFRHGFGDSVSPMCECNAEIEDTEHFLLRCHFYSIQRSELLSNINQVVLSNALNQDIMKFVINFLKKPGRFHKPLISFDQRFYVLLFFFLPIYLLYFIIFLLLLLITGYKSLTLTHFF